MLTVMGCPLHVHRKELKMRSTAGVESRGDSMKMRNSSPPMRATVSSPLNNDDISQAVLTKTASPNICP